MVMAPPTSRHFVDWKEEYVSNDRGSRVVHYYLKDRHGNAKLAVVGTERSLRHMVYVVSEEFLHLTNNSKSSSSSSMKWRSRREVVDWLSSLLPKPRPASSGDHITNITKSPRNNLLLMSDTDLSNDEILEPANHIHSSKGHLQKKPRPTNRNVAWLGAAWTCRKQLTHYQSFSHNGITVSVHDFVYMMAEGREHCIAYLEDMFEDSKARKLVRVQWFHKTNEVLENIPPPVPHARELFFASSSQVLNVKCVDGLATVLSPEHYEECWAKLPPEAAAHLYMCYRQFDNDVIKSFDLSQLEGYWHQQVLSSTDVLLPQYSPKHDLTSDSWDLDEEQETDLGTALSKGPRKSRSSRRRNGALIHSRRHVDAPDSLYRLSVCTEAEEDNNCTPDIRPPIKSMVNKSKEDVRPQGLVGFDIGDQVELLSQDSGIRGCWFKCTVISKQSHRLKVRYEDVQNEDESDNLEEWVPAFRVAAQDKLGIRIPGRLTIRPHPPEEETSSRIVVGTAVDAWWNDGWWEGVVVMMHEPKAEVHVYFPGENERSIFKRRDLRLSRDWVNNHWTLVKEAPNVANTQVSHDKKDGWLQSVTLPVICSVSSGLDELTRSDVCAKSKISPSSSVALRQSSELEEGGNSHYNERNMELKEEVGVDSVSSEKEQRACNLANDGLLGDLRWKSLGKRKRTREATVTVLSKTGTSGGKHMKMSRRKMVNGNRLKNGEDMSECNKKELAKRQRSGEELIKAKRLRQGHENLKSIHGCPIASPLFLNPMPLSNLVMSR